MAINESRLSITTRSIECCCFRTRISKSWYALKIDWGVSESDRTIRATAGRSHSASALQVEPNTLSKTLIGVIVYP